MRNIGILVLAPIVALLVSCAPPEQGVLNTFIGAVQAGNEDAVASVSVVTFPGKVTSWELVELGPESTEPFGLAGLYEEVASLKKEVYHFRTSPIGPSPSANTGWSRQHLFSQIATSSK